MPKNSKVHRCTEQFQRKHPEKPKGTAIAICSAATGQSYATGKKLK